MVGFTDREAPEPQSEDAMVQISDNAGNLIKKMTARHGFAGGGLRIGIKAGGCSGFSYTFAWEPAPRDGDLVFEGLDGSTVRPSTTTRAWSAGASFSTTRMPRAAAAAVRRSQRNSLARVSRSLVRGA